MNKKPGKVPVTCFVNIENYGKKRLAYVLERLSLPFLCQFLNECTVSRNSAVHKICIL